MNKYLFSIALVCGLVYVSSNVMAQSDDDLSKKIVKGDAVGCACCTRGGASSTSPIILALDLDKDGQISAVELKNAAASLSALDSDADGKISREEMHATSEFMNINARSSDGKSGRQLGVTLRYYVRQILKRHDKNGNRQLEITEMPDTMLAILDTIDVNGDQILSPQELLNMNREIRKRKVDVQPTPTNEKVRTSK